MHIGVDAVHTPTPVSSVACHRTNLPVGFADGPFPLPRERLALSATVGKPSFALRRNGPPSPSTAAPRAARNPDHSESASRSRWDLRSLHGDRTWDATGLLREQTQRRTFLRLRNSAVALPHADARTPPRPSEAASFRRTLTKSERSPASHSLHERDHSGFAGRLRCGALSKATQKGADSDIVSLSRGSLTSRPPEKRQFVRDSSFWATQIRDGLGKFAVTTNVDEPPKLEQDAQLAPQRCGPHFEPNTALTGPTFELSLTTLPPACASDAIHVGTSPTSDRTNPGPAIHSSEKRHETDRCERHVPLFISESPPTTSTVLGVAPLGITCAPPMDIP